MLYAILIIVIILLVIEKIVSSDKNPIPQNLENINQTSYLKSFTKRDNFINTIFSNLDIKLLRIPVQNFYNLDELEKQIQESL